MAILTPVTISQLGVFNTFSDPEHISMHSVAGWPFSHNQDIVQRNFTRRLMSHKTFGTGKGYKLDLFPLVRAHLISDQSTRIQSTSGSW